MFGFFYFYSHKMNRYLNIAIPVLVFLLLVPMLPYLPGMGYDLGKFQEWTLNIFQNGLRNTYGDTDYMPLYHYILWIYIKMAGSAQSIVDHIRYLRFFTLAFDFLGIWYVYKWINKKTAFFVLVLVSVLNLGYSYDTIIWSQVDGILSALVFIAIYYAWKGKNVLSAVFMVLAFNFKVQSIIVLPVWALLFLTNIIKDKSWKNVVLPVLASIAVQVIVVIPFLMGKYGLREITSIITNSFSVYQCISIKAANMWHWFVAINPKYGNETLIFTPDAKIFIAGLTYKQVGLSLFFIASFFTLLPMTILGIKNYRTGNKNFLASRELIWLTCALLYLLFYFFNTEIHDRYCQPSFIFITAYSFYTRKFTSYVLFSIMYFLTLEVSVQQFHFSNYETLIFDFRFLAGLTALVIIDLGRKIYKEYRMTLVSADAAGRFI